ncbi:MAG: DeoR/GlpR family DNA-binding transcription regulator [Eubacteriales bacterium]|nr:DeoR/GlpR family DNA-binding transcription regulator [Eubacteriales bacterium]
MARNQQILQFIDEQGHATTIELSRAFGIGESTARRTLARLESEGLIERYHGGALSLRGKQSLVYSRMRQHSEVKKKIGQAASRIIPEGSTILLLGGTTIQAICPYIREKHLTVITTNMLVFDELKDCANINLILLGGVYDHQEAELSGNLPGMNMTHMRSDYLFMGAYSFDEKHGFVVANFLNQFYHRCMEASDKVCLLIDSSKYKSGGTTIAAAPEMVDYLFTDSELAESAKKSFTMQGVQVILCDQE